MKCAGKIDYLEFWATRHCNLNCRGCSSCSPISEPWFLREEMLVRDLRRLSDLGLEVGRFNVLGGEPLLHPKLWELLECVKRFFPEADLGVITNGLLIPDLDDGFGAFCRERDVEFCVTLFPVLSEQRRSRIVDVLKGWGVRFKLTDKRRFNKILTRNRTASRDAVLLACGCKGACNLFDGTVSRCTVPMVVETLNRRFGCGLLEGGRLNIHSAEAAEIVRFLQTPNESCGNCSARPVKIPWAQVGDEPKESDWIIGG